MKCCVLIKTLCVSSGRFSRTTRWNGAPSTTAQKGATQQRISNWCWTAPSLWQGRTKASLTRHCSLWFSWPERFSSLSTCASSRTVHSSLEGWAAKYHLNITPHIYLCRHHWEVHHCFSNLHVCLKNQCTAECDQSIPKKTIVLKKLHARKIDMTKRSSFFRFYSKAHTCQTEGPQAESMLPCHFMWPTRFC